jgi:nucleotide-binding universal stress UspA family protein
MENLFSHILVPVDFSEQNLAAIAAAMQLARHNDARITLLHVIEFIDFPEDDEIAGFYEKLRARSERELDRLQATVGERDVQVRVDTIINHRSRGIALYAVDNQVDLIVMSSHAVNPVRGGEGWGTISYQVSALCPCSIMLVKPPATPPPDRE